MRIRHGLALMMAFGFGLTGCASGGGGGDIPTPTTSAGGQQLAQGERPRDTGNTRAAERHIEAAQDAESPEEARMHYQQAVESAIQAVQEDPRNPLAHRLAAEASLALEDSQHVPLPENVVDRSLPPGR